MKKYLLQIIIIPPFGKVTVVFRKAYKYQWWAVVVAWYHARHYSNLTRHKIFKVQTKITPQ